MNNLYKRPMFRKGGSAEGGITSGLGRPGYAENGSVEELTTKERLLQAMGAQPSKQNFNDFLINFGLNMASNAPSGNIFQTAAAQAKDPYADFSKANQAEQNLLRQVGLEAETLDIGSENAAAAAKALEKGKADRLKTELDARALEFQNEQKVINAEAKNAWVSEWQSENGGSKIQAENLYEFYNNTTNKPEFKNLDIGGTIENSTILLGGKDLQKWVKKNKKKKDQLFLNSTTGDLFQIKQNEDQDYNLIKVGNTSGTSTTFMDSESKKGNQIIETGDVVTTKKDLTGETITVDGEAVIDKISPKDIGYDNKPVFESIAEVRSVMEFPMTVEEIIAKYEIPESFFRGYNKKQTFQPIKKGDSAYKEGDLIYNNIYKNLQKD